MFGKKRVLNRKPHGQVWQKKGGLLCKMGRISPRKFYYHLTSGAVSSFITQFL